MGEMIYAPYDLTGIKFLWWTWHDTDAPVSQRILGVPVGSTVWVITFTASFQVNFSNNDNLRPRLHRDTGGLFSPSLRTRPGMILYNQSCLGLFARTEEDHQMFCFGPTTVPLWLGVFSRTEGG